MTQTYGYYCPNYKKKFPPHVCKNGLPCGHDFKDAFFVYVKRYAHDSEKIKISGQGITFEVSGNPIVLFENWFGKYSWECFGDGFRPKNIETFLVFSSAFENRWMSITELEESEK